MKRFAITHVNSDGMRVLTLPNQGRQHYADQRTAEIAMRILTPGLRAKILGSKADTLEVREVECYAHGDAKGNLFRLKL